jgi:hypothetical protein
MPRQRLRQSHLTEPEIRALEAAERGELYQTTGRQGALICATVGSRALHNVRRSGFIEKGVVCDGKHVMELTARGREELNIARSDRPCAPPSRIGSSRRPGANRGVAQRADRTARRRPSLQGGDQT